MNSGRFLRSPWTFLAIIAGTVVLRASLNPRGGEDFVTVFLILLISVLLVVGIPSYFFFKARPEPKQLEYGLVWSFTGLYLLFLFRDTPLKDMAVFGALVFSAIVAWLIDEASFVSKPMSHSSSRLVLIARWMLPIVAGSAGVMAAYYIWTRVHAPMRQLSVAVLVVFFAVALIPRSWLRNAATRMMRRVLLVGAVCFLTYVLFPII